MNQKVILGILIAVGVLAAVGMPMLYNATRNTPEQQEIAISPTPPVQPPPPPPPPVPEPAPEPIIWEGTYEQPARPLPQYLQKQQQAKAGQKKPAADSSSLNAETLVGTAWQVDSPYGAVMVEFGPNGQGVATHPMVGSIPATWHVAGNKVVANASFMGQSIKIDASIQGETLAAPGQNIRRVR